MAASLTGLGSHTEAVSGSAHSFTVSWGGGSGVVALLVSAEFGGTITAATFDGVSMGSSVASITHSAGQNSLTAFCLAVTGLAPGTITVGYTTSSSTAAVSAYAWRVDDAESVVIDTATAEANTSVSTISSAVDCVPDGAVLAAFQSGAASVTWDSYSGVAERLELNEVNYTTSFADALTTATEARTVSGTANSTSGNKVMMALSFAPSSGGSNNAPRSQFYHLQGMR